MLEKVTIQRLKMLEKVKEGIRISLQGEVFRYDQTKDYGKDRRVFPLP